MDIGKDNYRDPWEHKTGTFGELASEGGVIKVDGIPGRGNSRCKALRWEDEKPLRHKHHCHNKS